jgi:hypothetical protein
MPPSSCPKGNPRVLHPQSDLAKDFPNQNPAGRLLPTIALVDVEFGCYGLVELASSVSSPRFPLPTPVL